MSDPAVKLTKPPERALMDLLLKIGRVHDEAKALLRKMEECRAAKADG